MLIKAERPPLFDEICRTFPLVNRPGVIFAWGNTIYNPSGITIGPELMAHESVHGARQLDQMRELGDDNEAVEGWWHRYLSDPDFRLVEEVHAHVAEYAVVSVGRGRNERRALLTYVARRLTDPLYGYKPGLTIEHAKRLLKSEIGWRATAQ